MSGARDAARDILATATGLAAEQIPDDASMFTLEAWDSLAHARIVLGIEQSRGRELPPEDLFEIDSLDAIAKSLCAGDEGV